MIKQSQCQWRAAMFVLGAVAFLAGCAGDDDDTSVDVSGISLTPAVLSAPASGTTTLSIGYNAKSMTYPGTTNTAAISAFLLSASAAPGSASSANQIVSSSCGLASLFCSASCTFSSERVLSCGGPVDVTLSRGSYSILGRVCVKNQSNGDVCGEKIATLTVN